MRFADEVIFESIEGEVLVLDLGADEYFALEGIGGRVWQLIGEGGDLDSMVVKLGDEFEVEESVLRRDLLSFVDDLRARGLIVDDEEQ